MLLLPLRVEDAEVDRLPWVSIGIAAICTVMFFATWVAPKHPDGLSQEGVERVLKYWDEHHYLRLPERMERMMPPSLRAGYEKMRAAEAGQLKDRDPEEVAAEQKELNARADELFKKMDSSLMRRLSLVPERGLGQKGLLTHMFLHFGWEHFLFNMLFFYVAGLLLEDRWGRGVFAAFYLAGGLVAAVGQYLLDTSSQGMIAGASGAIAACMGAFSARFPDRQIRMGYWILWIWAGTFLVRAWVWGLIWFGLEVLALSLLGNSSGVAFGAHVGGFAFGAVVALGLKWSGVEKRFITASMERKEGAYTRHEGLDAAEAAVARGDAPAARQELEAILAQSPDSVDANVMLIKLEVASDPAAAHARAERFLTKLFTKDSAEVVGAVEELAGALDVSLLRPATVFRMGQALDRGSEGLKPVAERFFATTAAQPGPFAAKALVRAAQARLDAHGEVRGALDYLATLRALPGVQSELLARAEELEQRAQQVLEREKGIDPRVAGQSVALEEAPARALELSQGVVDALPVTNAPPAAEPSRSGAKVVECQLGGMTRDALSLVMEGGRQAQVSIANLLAVAVGVAGEPSPPPSPPRQILYTDLVTSWGSGAEPAQVLRLKSSTLRLHNIYPGMPPQEAYAQFLSHLLDMSGATALPDATALRRGQYPRFPDVETFTRTLYG